RMRRAADIIINLVGDCMTKTMNTQLKSGDDHNEVQKSLMPRYTDWLRQREVQSHHELRIEFRHRHFEMEIKKDDLVSLDLFSKETWRVLGLTRRQLTTISALAGAAAGAAVDLALGEISFGIFMAGGAVLGAVSGLAGSRPLSQVRFRLAGMNHQLGHRYVELGPPRGVQLAFILIDRALLYLDTVSRWAHAKRERVEVDKVVGSLPLTRLWTRKDQAAVSRFAGRLIKRKRVEKELYALRGVLTEVLTNPGE
ncbi:MAG: DUF3482 domain-containing protein, partial [Spirochaetaceae bacterium]|nr:DUF3482 domain-containing protein [Spirochaetaceae bacterium]